MRSNRRGRTALSRSLEPLESRRLMSATILSEPDPAFPDEFEPNNSFGQAYNFGPNLNQALGGLTLHRFGTTLDQDYYRFTPNASGVFNVSINFTHLRSNLTLRAYDANQNQIAQSATNSNTESFTIPVSAGQTYFIRVTGPECDDYSFNTSFAPLSANWDWSMPARYGAARDQFGLPVIPNTREYAFPNPIWLGGREVARYPVSLSAGTNVAGFGYSWSIVGSQYSTNTTGASPTVDLPEGRYTATLTVTTPTGQSISSTQQINVKNHLIVAIGDSYSSGEGNPHSPQQYDWLGFTTRGAVWADSPDAQEAVYHRMAHRSAHAGVAQAALWLENSDPKSSVTFVFVSHTGSTILTGLLGPIASGDHAVSGQTPAQLDRVSSIVGNQRIDSMIISIGGNDIGFADILTSLVFAENDLVNGNYQGELDNIFNAALGRLQQLRDTWYPQLAARLRQFDIGQVGLVEYPDLTRDSSGNTANSILHDILPGREVDRYELDQARQRLMGPFSQVMREAADRFGWAYIGGVQDGFRFSEYGTWFRSAVDSTRVQGPLGNYNMVTIGDLNETDGKMHPIGQGLTVVKDRIIDFWNKPDLALDNLNIAPDAFIRNASSGYSITIRNTSLRAATPASQVLFVLSPDEAVNASDRWQLILDVPAIEPGESVTLNGVFAPQSDPFRLNNRVYVSAILDHNNLIGESRETDNTPAVHGRVTSLVSERDLNGGTLVSRPAQIGSTVTGRIGDELIGDFDLDVFHFSAWAGERIRFELSSPIATSIRIYQAIPAGDGFLLWGNPLASGSNAAEHQFAGTGHYVVVVGSAANANGSPVALWDRQAGPHGDYALSSRVLPTIIPPKVLASGFDVDRNSVWYRFDTDVSASIDETVLTVRNSLGYTPDIGYWYDPSTNTAHFVFPDPDDLNGMDDGLYTATLDGSRVRSAEGAALGQNSVLQFHVLAGDANRDRRVDFADLLIVAQNYGQDGKSFSEGNFDYSGDGLVGFEDLLMLAQRYGVQLMSAPAATNSPFQRDRTIADDTLD